MQQMQDSEFDKLFREKLGEAEIQPSANLWDSIAGQLGPKKRRGLPIFWMAAAVVLLALLVALLMPETEKIRLQGSGIASSMAPVIDVEEVASTAGDEPITALKEEHKSTPLVIAPRITNADVKKDFAVMQPIPTNDHLVSKGPEATPPVMISSDQEPVKIDTDVVIANADVAVADNSITESNERRGIKNVGDLVNYVVEKVDKRDKKFIKFNTDEDDNSSLVAINIGIFKFNKRSDK
jgi:hypothetical protein